MAKEEEKKTAKSTAKSTKKTTAKKAEPKKTETKKVEAKKTEAKKTPKKVTPKKVEPKKTETKKATPKKETPKKETKVVQEENNYTHTIIAAFIVAAVCILGFILIKNSTSEEANYKPTKDETTFKEEYESLNGKSSKEGTKYLEVSVLKANKMKYISMEEAAKKLENGTALIYYGYAGSNESRKAIEVLLDVASKNDVEEILYVNLRPSKGENLEGIGEKEDDLRDTYTLSDHNKPRKTKDAQESYYKTLTYLANYLEDYVLFTEKGRPVKTGYKRLHAPTLVAVKNGEILGFQEKTTAKESDKELTSEEKKELSEKYDAIIKAYKK